MAVLLIPTGSVDLQFYEGLWLIEGWPIVLRNVGYPQRRTSDVE
jgi:hypothetical protein